LRQLGQERMLARASNRSTIIMLSLLWFSKSLIHTVEVDVLTCPVALRLRGLVGGVVDDVHDLEVVPESSTNPATVKRI